MTGKFTPSLCIAALVFAAGGSIARADSEADFYRGKTIRIIMGFGNFSRTVPLEPLLDKKEKAQFDALKFT